MGYDDFVAGQQQARFGSALREMRNTDTAREWERYARQLEAQLALAHAETLVARIQRNAYRNAAVKFSGMDEMIYRKKFVNEVITPELAKNGLRVDLSGNVKRIR